MSRTFDAMAQAVQSHTVELERQVEARTAELQRIADRDQMTGIRNRRGFIAAFEAIRAAAAPETRMALLLIDVDDFKTINDSFGHFVGDRVVIEIAQRLDSLLRSTDVCGRWGGDELILLVGDIGDHDVGAVAEAVRVALVARSIDIGDGRVVRPVSALVPVSSKPPTAWRRSPTRRIRRSIAPRPAAATAPSPMRPIVVPGTSSAPEVPTAIGSNAHAGNRLAGPAQFGLDELQNGRGIACRVSTSIMRRNSAS